MNVHLDDALAQEIFVRFRALRHRFEHLTLKTTIHDLLLTDTVVTAIGIARTQVVIDRDLQQIVHANKSMREFALSQAVSWGFLEQTEFTSRRGNTSVAWRRATASKKAGAI